MQVHDARTHENQKQLASGKFSHSQAVEESSFQSRDENTMQRVANYSPQVARLQSLQVMADNSLHTRQAVQLQMMADNSIARVPMIQRKGVQVNDNVQLEKEADRMGTKANSMQLQSQSFPVNAQPGDRTGGHPVQLIERPIGLQYNQLPVQGMFGLGNPDQGGYLPALVHSAWSLSGRVLGFVRQQTATIYNSVRNRIPSVDVTSAVSHVASYAASTVIATYVPVEVPVLVTYVVRGATYGFVYNLTGIIVDYTVLGALPSARTSATSLARSAGYGAGANIVPGLLPGNTTAMLLNVFPATVISLRGLWQEQRTIAHSRDPRQIPQGPGNMNGPRALALGVFDVRRGINYDSFARDHGAYTWRYMLWDFGLFMNDWERTFRHIVNQASHIHVNLEGVRGGRNEGNLQARDAIALNPANIRTVTIRVGRSLTPRILPANGFTNYEIAYLVANSNALPPITWWNGSRQLSDHSEV